MSFFFELHPSSAVLACLHLDHRAGWTPIKLDVGQVLIDVSRAATWGVLLGTEASVKHLAA